MSTRKPEVEKQLRKPSRKWKADNEIGVTEIREDA
jgi:hypothetical protein